MQHFVIYLPLIILLLSIFALIFVTASDRSIQILQLRDFSLMVTRFAKKSPRVHLRLLTIKRVIVAIVLIHLVTFFILYQVLQDRIASLLIEKNIEKVKVESLIIPYFAFFQSDYTANTGFKKSKKRTRVDIQVNGHLWSGLRLGITEIATAKINSIIGKQFVFSYMTDTKKLTPEIHKHLKREVASKVIVTYELEKFDNRGPYIVVILSEKNRSKDRQQVATEIAKRLLVELTVAKGLKVNYVVVKVADPEIYKKNNRIKVIAKGTAGTY